MPLFFIVSGLQTDVFAIKKMDNVGSIQLLACASFVGKVLGTILPPLCCRMPIRDALSLALVMNTKSIAELGFMIQMKHMNVSHQNTFLACSKQDRIYDLFFSNIDLWILFCSN